MQVYHFNSPLLSDSSHAWLDAVLNDFDTFLLDHAACEKKASGMAISLISHYPDRIKLVEAMADLAIEELAHYKEVIKIIHSRSLILGADNKDHYVNGIRKHVRNGKMDYFLDRLVTAGIIEARGAERFGLIANALPKGRIKNLYITIANSEQKHYSLFINLASLYFERETVIQRADELLSIEAEILASLPILPQLH